MSKKDSNSGQLSIRQMRTFSEKLKRRIVDDLVNKRTSFKEIMEVYGISRTSVYNWLYAYSPHHQQGTRQVIEMESEASKTRLLQKRVAELERVLGRKQLQIDYLEKLIEISSEELKTDLKKTFGDRPSNGSVNTGNYMDTV